MRVVKVLGADDAACAALVTTLIAALARRGRAVSVVARVAPELDIDHPGKDGHKHRVAGARDVATISPTRYALIHEARPTEPAANLATLLARLSPVDFVFALGFDEPQGEVIQLRDGAVEFLPGRRFARDDFDGLAACLADAL